MTPNEITLKKHCEGKQNEYWAFDVVGNCGKRSFANIALLLEPLSINPVLQFLSSSLGLRATKKVLQMVETERAKFGLTTLE